MPRPPDEPDDAALPVPINVKFAMTGIVNGVELNPRSSPTLNTGRVSADDAAPSGRLLQFEKDIGAQACNRAFMQLQTGRIFQPEVSEVDGYWVRVLVAQDLRFPEQFQCEENQVVEIDGVAGVEGLLIPLANMLRDENGAWIGEFCGIGAAVLESAENAQDGARFDLFAFGGKIAQHFLHRAELIALAVDDKVAFVTKQLDVLSENADEPRAELLARQLAGRLFATTTDLAAAVRRALGERMQADEREQSVRRVFQAVRIAVNDEFAALDCLLRQLPSCLKPGGRVAILTFHSGEDRRVKKAFATARTDGSYTAISDEVLRPSASERHANPRSTSAKLRWARVAV